MKTRILSLLLSVCLSLNIFSQTSSGSSMVLHEHWYIQSSANLTDNGKVISLPGYVAKEWYPTTVPTTVLAALVANKVYPDPYYGNNYLELPGIIPYPKREMPDGSPFKVAWWYRTEFKIPADYKKMHTWLQFHSIN